MEIQQKITLSLSDIEPYTHYQNCNFTVAYDQVRISDCIFENCTFPKQTYIKSEFLDCTFQNIILSNYNFSESIFYRCTFESCQLLGTNFSINRWKDIRINNSRGDFLNLSEAKIENITFDTSTLKDAFFQSVVIKKKLIFTDCELSQADFSETKLAAVDISTSQFETLVVTPTLLKGITISYFQAAQFMSMLGAKIK